MSFHGSCSGEFGVYHGAWGPLGIHLDARHILRAPSNGDHYQCQILTATLFLRTRKARSPHFSPVPEARVSLPTPHSLPVTCSRLRRRFLPPFLAPDLPFGRQEADMPFTICR